MVIGVANMGGRILDSWMPSLVEALEAGLDLVGGMHTRLRRHAGVGCSRRASRASADRRPHATAGHSDRHGSQAQLVSGLLAVGTDCALGKKYTALAICEGTQAAWREAPIFVPRGRPAS